MILQRYKFRRAVTLIELMIAVLAVMILVVGISGILVSGHRNYNTMFERINSEVVRNAYEARRIFDRIVRESIIEYVEINEEGDDLTVFYYSDPNDVTLAVLPDRYAHFYTVQNGDDTELVVVTGVLNLVITSTQWFWNKQEVLNTLTVAHNVDLVEFTIKGVSIRMELVLDNESNPQNTNKLETLKMTVTTTAIRHNKLPI
ncbi:MAG: hypothetical protein JW715_05185 [Sedimentisphaerales bacterium]|nr:hypothetical protein [Sedimentisphaerales bacterium]